MSRSIRISDELAEFADAAAGFSHRSPPQQIEHWAQLGRILEPALSYRAESAIKQVGRADLDAVLARVGSPESVRRTQAIIRRTSGAIVSTDT
ncbi:MAG: hypothetical protein KDK99_17180 [Verrucomicrobiales bacterium]|nr:hypothetical protein [Verrucomicrobiales bacterium]